MRLETILRTPNNRMLHTWLSAFYSMITLNQVANTQKNYFDHLAGLILEAEHRIRMVGYDKEFMEYEPTRLALEHAVNNTKVDFKAIGFPLDAETSYLSQGGTVEIEKTPETLTWGFIEIDSHYRAIWDSSKLTKHKGENHKGVIQRNLKHLPGKKFKPLTDEEIKYGRELLKKHYSGM